MKIYASKGQRQIVSFSELNDLEDPDSGEKLKFEFANHDEMHEGLVAPVYQAKNKEGRVFTATFNNDNIRVEAGEKPKPKDEFEEQKKASEDRNAFIPGKQTPDTFPKTDKELGLESDKEEDIIIDDLGVDVEENKNKKGTKKK